MTKTDLIISAILLSAAMAVSPTASAADSDALLRAKLAGDWTLAIEHATDAEKIGIEHGIFAVETFKADGNGAFVVYKGRLCGPILQAFPFHWTIGNGVLVSTPRGLPQSHDRIVKLAASQLELWSVEHSRMQYRVRTAGCATS
jgi:hypothetical protein